MFPQIQFPNGAPPPATNAVRIDPERCYEFPVEFDGRFEAFVRDSLRRRQVSAATARWYQFSYRILSKYLHAAGVKVVDATIGSHIEEWLAPPRPPRLSPLPTPPSPPAVRAPFT